MVDANTAVPIPNRVHLIGAGGAGMSGIAKLLSQRHERRQIRSTFILHLSGQEPPTHAPDRK